MKLRIAARNAPDAKRFGYIRVSTAGQNPARQKEEMEALGIPESCIYVDYASGKDFDRPQYQALRRAVRKGDVVFFDSLDRLGRNYEEIRKEWLYLSKEVGIDLVCLDIKMVDTREFRKYPPEFGRFIEDLMLSILSWRSDCERSEILRRQRQGIELAKAAGKYHGKPRKPYDHAIFADYCGRIQRGEIRQSWAITQMRMSKSTFERRYKEWKAK